MKGIKKLILWYLRTLARLQLFKVKPVIIGIGGASGKTSLAKIVAVILSQKYKVCETNGKNSETGIPLSILGISVENYSILEWIKILIISPLKVIFDYKHYDFLIAEMGIDSPYEPKNMSYLLKIVKPSIGILTNIYFEHSQYFDNLTSEKKENKRREEILNATEKQEVLLLESIPSSGLSVINFDNQRIKNSLGNIKSKITTVSLKDKKADFFGKKIAVDLNTFKLNFIFKNKSYNLKINTPLPVHYAYSFLFAIAIGSVTDIPVEQQISTLENKFSLPPGRMSIFKGIKDTVIIDSSYNNVNVNPIVDILSLLKEIAGVRRKVAIIGDMRELGSMSKNQHEILAKKILETADLVILIGPMTKQFISPVLKKNNHLFYSFLTFSEAKNVIKNLIKHKDIIMVKGSQNNLFLERIVEMLLADSKDIAKLARRGKFWDKKRKESL